MSGFISLGLVLHIIFVGVCLGKTVKTVRLPLVAGVFVYFFIAHLALGLALGAFPDLIDPR